MTPHAATEAERLTLEQCDEFRRHPGTFNQMVQAIYDAGQARALQQTAEPNFWAVLADHGDDFTGDKELADYWDRKGRTVVALYRAAPDRAPSTDSAADARDAALWRNLIDDTNAQPCAYKCLRDDLGDWIRERAGVQTVGKDTERLDFIQSQPEIRLIYRKNRWGFVGCTNYEYEVFKTVREAIDAAIAASLPQTKEE